MSSQNDVLRKFCAKHKIQVVNTNKLAHKYYKINLNYFRNTGKYDSIQNHIDMVSETEPLYTIEISESELEKIAEFEISAIENLERHGHYGIFQSIMEEKEQEKYLKNKYPAVKKAYEQYTLMLKLAQSGEI